MNPLSHTPVKERVSILESLFLVTLGLILLTPVFYTTEIAKGVLFFKFFYLFYLSCFCSLLCIVKIAQKKTVTNLSITTTDILVVIFFLYLLTNIAYASDRVNYGSDKTDKLIIFISSIVTYFSIKIFFRPGLFSNILFKGIALILLNIAIFECFFATLQQLGLFPGFNENVNLHVTGTFTHPAMLGGFLAMVAPFLFAQTKIKFRKFSDLLKVEVLTGLLILLAFLFTKSRGALLAAIIAILYINYHQQGIMQQLVATIKKNKVIGIAAVAGILLITYGLIIIRTSSVFGRVLIWKISCTMIKDAPIFGHGLGSFRDIYPAYQIKYFANSNSDFEKSLADYVNFSFNEFLQIWLELGVMGVILLIAIPVSLYFKKDQGEFIEKSPAINGVKGSILAFAIFCISSYPFSLNYMVLYFFIFLSIANCQTPGSLFQKRKFEKLIYCITLFIVLLAPFYFFRSVSHKLISYKKLVTAERTPDPEKANKIYRDQFNVLNNDGYYLSKYTEHLMRSDHPKLGLEILKNKKGLTFTDYLLMGDLYLKVGKKDSALKYYIDASNLLPNEPLPVEKISDLKK